jgi:hypothetical protein
MNDCASENTYVTMQHTTILLHRQCTSTLLLPLLNSNIVTFLTVLLTWCKVKRITYL